MSDYLKRLVERDAFDPGRGLIDGVKIRDMTREQLLAVCDYLIEQQLILTGRWHVGVMTTDPTFELEDQAED
jgi:hypothetical protein